MILWAADGRILKLKQSHVGKSCPGLFSWTVLQVGNFALNREGAFFPTSASHRTANNEDENWPLSLYPLNILTLDVIELDGNRFRIFWQWYLCSHVCYLNDFLGQTGVEPLESLPVGDEQLKHVAGCLSHCFVPKLDRQTRRQEPINDGKGQRWTCVLTESNSHLFFTVH